MPKDIKIRTVVVGAKHYGPDAIEATGTLVEGEHIDLRREPDNQYDRNAIACYVGEVKIGMLPKSAVPTIAPVMDAGAAVDCIITGVPLLIGERIDVPPHVSVNWTEE